MTAIERDNILVTYQEPHGNPLVGAGLVPAHASHKTGDHKGRPYVATGIIN